MDVARLAVDVDSDSVKIASTNLEEFASDATRASAAAKGLGTSTGAAGAGMRKAAADVGQYGRTAQASGAYTANLAAQFNDIGMMLAAGQSPLMLAAQQGTQVSQVLNQMGGGRKAIQGLGAAFASVINPTSLLTLGIIAGGAALGQWGLRALGARDKGESLKEVIAGLTEVADEASASLQKMRFGVETSEEAAALSQIAEITGRIAAQREQLANADNRQARNIRGTIDALIRQREELRGALGDTQDLVGLQAILEGAQKAIAQAEADQRSERERTLEIEAEHLARAQEIGNELRQQAEVSLTIAQHGEDSAAVTELRARHERDNFRAMLDTLQVSDAVKNELMGAMINAQRLAQEARNAAGGLGAANSQAIALQANLIRAANAISAISNATYSLGVDTVGLQAQNRALAAGNDMIAARGAALRAQKREELSPFLGSEDAILRQAATEQLYQYNDALAENMDAQRANAAAVDAYNESLRAVGGGGGGGGSAGAAAAATEEYGRVLEEVESIIQAFNEEQRRMSDLATDWIDTFTSAAMEGNLRRAFTRLGDESRGAFFEALGRGESLGSIFSTSVAGVSAGISAMGSAGNLGGTMAGLGGVISSAMPILGAVSAAAGLLSSFSSSETLAQGVRGSIGAGGSARDFETVRRSRFWGLSSSTSTTSSRNRELTRLLREGAADVRAEIDGLAMGIGGTARDLSTVRRRFKLDTQGMDRQQIERALEDEFNSYREAVAGAALGSKANELALAGESAIDTLGRLTTNLQTYNDVQRVLGLDTLPRSIESAARASRLLSAAGGGDALSLGASTAFGFMSLTEQRNLTAQRFRNVSGQGGIGSREEFMTRYERLVGRGQNVQASRLLSAAPLFDELMNLRDAVKEAADATKEAAKADRAAAKAEREALRDRRLNQREDLTRQLLSLQGKEEELRQRILDQDIFGRRNKVLQQQIWAIEDMTEAMSAVDDAVFATIYDERRARLDAQAGRDWRTSYEQPMLAMFQELLDEMKMGNSTARITAAATQRSADATEITLARSVAGA